MSNIKQNINSQNKSTLQTHKNMDMTLKLCNCRRQQTFTSTRCNKYIYEFWYIHKYIHKLYYDSSIQGYSVVI